MTYLQFHLIFILPPLLALGILGAPHLVRTPRLFAAILAMAAVALVYTTPWDNYLVWRGVWSYGAGRVVGTIGYVPVEEYAFFLLQPILAGLWFVHVASREKKPPPPLQSSRFARWLGAGIGILLAILGGVMLLSDATTYMGLILSWSAPVLALQWGWTGDWFWRLRRRWLLGVLVPTLYLWITDRIAIEFGVWSISERFTTGLHLFGLPLEEAVFFLATNILVVQGLIMLSSAPVLIGRDAYQKPLR